MTKVDTVIVGGGAIGVAAAWYLAERGQRVAVLEQGGVCSGCSRGNAGQITPGHLPLQRPGMLWRNLRWALSAKSPLFVAPRFDPDLFRWLIRFQRASDQSHVRHATEILCRLGTASEQLFEQLARQIGFRYAKRGRLEICRSQRAFQAACKEAQLLNSFGFEFRLLHGEEVNDFEPAVTARVAGAVFYPESAFCEPQQFVLKLAEAAAGRGVLFHTETTVTGLKRERDRIRAVSTPQGDLEADHVVLACGAWTPQLLRPLGRTLPLQPGKGYHLDLPPPPVAPRRPLVLLEEKIFVTPFDGVLRLAGTMEFSGFNLRQRPGRLKMLLSGAQHYLAEIDGKEVLSRWCHLRPMSPDGLPIIGPVRSPENLWVATGHGMLGLTQAPVTGQLLAESITGGSPSPEMAPLSPDRF